MGNPSNQLPDGYKEMQGTTGEISLARGAVVLADNVAMHVMECTLTIILNAVAGAAALTEAKKNIILGKLTMRFAYNAQAGKTKAREKFQSEPLARVRAACMMELGEDFAGINATTGEGWGKALLAGANTLTIVIPVGTGLLKSVPETQTVGGMGKSQAATVEVNVKALGFDALTTADANLSVSKVTMSFAPRLHAVSGNQWGAIAEFRTLTSPGKADIELPDGFPIAADYITDVTPAPTALQRYTASVRDTVVVRQATPAAFLADYNRRAGLDATTGETGIGLTPLFRQEPGPMGRQLTGPLTLTQDDKVTEWNVLFLYLPAISEEEGRRMVENVASQMKLGGKVHAVSSARLEDLAVSHNHVQFCGWRVFEDSERQYSLYPGLRCETGGRGNAKVYLPPMFLESNVSAWETARAAKDEGLEESIERNVGLWIPYVMVDGAGWNGASTQARQDVNNLFEKYSGQRAAQRVEQNNAQLNQTFALFLQVLEDRYELKRRSGK